MESASIKGLAVIVPWIWWVFKFLICGELSYCIPIGLFCYLIKLLDDEQKRYATLLMRENMEEKIILDGFSQTEGFITIYEVVQTDSEMHMNNKQTECNLENKNKADTSTQTDEIFTIDKELQTSQVINISNKEAEYDWPKQTKTDVSETAEIMTNDQDLPATPEICTENMKTQYTCEKHEKNILPQTTKIASKDKFLQTTVDANTSNKKIQTGTSRTYTCLLYYPIGHGGEPRRKLKEKIQFKPTFRTIQETEEDTLFNKASNESKISGIPEQDTSLRVIHFTGKEIRYRVKLSPPPKLSSLFEVQEITSNTSKEKTLNTELSKQLPIPAPLKNVKFFNDPNQQNRCSILNENKKIEMKQKGKEIPYIRKKLRKMKNWFLEK